MQPERMAAYDAEVATLWDHSNTAVVVVVVAVVVLAAAEIVVVASEVHILCDCSRWTQCCYQIRSTDYN